MSGILNMYSIGHVARQAPCVLLHALWWSAVSNCQRAYHAGVMTAAQAAVLPPVEAFTFAPVPPNAPTVTYAVAAAGTALNSTSVAASGAPSPAGAPALHSVSSASSAAGALLPLPSLEAEAPQSAAALLPLQAVQPADAAPPAAAVVSQPISPAPAAADSSTAQPGAQGQAPST